MMIGIRMRIMLALISLGMLLYTVGAPSEFS
jgi:hypothetical protein